MSLNPYIKIEDRGTTSLGNRAVNRPRLALISYLYPLIVLEPSASSFILLGVDIDTFNSQFGGESATQFSLVSIEMVEPIKNLSIIESETFSTFSFDSISLKQVVKSIGVVEDFEFSSYFEFLNIEMKVVIVSVDIIETQQTYA